MEGTTQNPNKDFNKFVWERCPKQTFTFASKQVSESGVNSSVLTYNDGFMSLKIVFEKLDIKLGKHFLEGAYSRDCLRVEKMDQKTLQVANNRKEIESH